MGVFDRLDASYLNEISRSEIIFIDFPNIVRLLSDNLRVNRMLKTPFFRRCELSSCHSEAKPKYFSGLKSEAPQNNLASKEFNYFEIASSLKSVLKMKLNGFFNILTGYRFIPIREDSYLCADFILIGLRAGKVL
jgi:hypothetical protein